MLRKQASDAPLAITASVVKPVSDCRKRKHYTTVSKREIARH